MKNSVLIVASLVLAPGCGFAQSGVVLINQTTTAASGQNPSTGGVPYVIAQPGNCQRTANPTAAPDGPIRLNTLSGIPVVDGVFLNGSGPYRFVLDTGGQLSQLEASIAGKLGLTPTFQVDVATTTGSIHGAGGRIAQVSLGSATASNQEFLFTTLDGAHALSADIKGVLGQQFLAKFDYLLDFAHHRLAFGEPAPTSGNRVNFETVHGRPAIQTSEGRLTLDSGTNVLVLYGPASEHLVSAGNYGPVIRTDAGTAPATALEGFRLRIAGREYHPANAAASARRDLLGDDGVLPASLFHAVFVSNSGKYLILDPSADSGPARER